MRRNVAVLSLVVLLHSLPRGVSGQETIAESPFAVAYGVAKTQYESAWEAFAGDVDEYLAREETKVRRSGTAAEVQTFELQRTQFDRQEIIPVGLPNGMKRRVDAIATPLKNAAEAYVRSLRRDGETVTADRIERETATLLAPIRRTAIRDQIVGDWNLKAGRYRAPIRIFPDGRFFNGKENEWKEWTIDLDENKIVAKPVTPGLNVTDTIHLPVTPRTMGGVSSRNVKLEFTRR